MMHLAEDYGNPSFASRTSERMKLHLKLHKHCAEKGWDQSELLKQSGQPVSPSTMSSYWAGRTKPSLDAALAFCRALGLPLEYLADDAQDDPPASPGLSEQETVVLALSREMGMQTALRRLARLPELEGGSQARTESLRPLP